MHGPDPSATPPRQGPTTSTGERLRDLWARVQAEVAAGRREAACGHLETMLALSGQDAAVARAAGMLAYQARWLPESIAWLQRAVDGVPADVEARMWLGMALCQYGRANAAVEHLQRACELAPGAVNAWCALADVARLAGRADIGMPAAQRALACEPGNARAMLALAGIQSGVGEIAAAAATLRDLLAHDAGNALAWLALANLKTVPFTARERRLLAGLFTQPGRAAEARAPIGFAFAQALEDGGDYLRAFDVFAEANVLRRRQVHWDGAALSASVDAIMHASRALRAEDSGSAAAGAQLIFVAAVPRSGSSLLAQVLASHPDVGGAGEEDHLMRVIDAESHRRGTAFPAWVPDTDLPQWGKLAHAYLDWCNPGVGRGFVDKGMTNWLLVDAVLRMFPASHVIICRRDPLETCLGCYRQYFTQGAAFTYDLDEMAAYYADFDRLTRFWQRRFPERVLTVRYEALVAEPATVIPRVLQFCGLPFHAGCLTPHRTQRMILSAPSAAQVRQPLHAGTARALRYGARLDHLRARLTRYGLGDGGA